MVNQQVRVDGTEASALAVSPEGLSSRSLTDPGAQIDHLDSEELRNVQLLPDSHRSPEELEGDHHCHILNTHTHRELAAVHCVLTEGAGEKTSKEQSRGHL